MSSLLALADHFTRVEPQPRVGLEPTRRSATPGQRSSRQRDVAELSYDLYGGKSSGHKNIEHVFPRSWGGDNDPVNLFSVDVSTNSLRANYPFGDVDVLEREIHGFKLGLDARGETVAEPPPEFRGDAARVWFHMARKVSVPIPDDTEAVLRRWDKEDPVDARELERNQKLMEKKGVRNEFVSDPRLIDAIPDL